MPGAASTPPGPSGPVSPDEHHRHGLERRGAPGAGGGVLVLNATYEPINVCPVRRAVVLLIKRRAELVEAGSLQLRSEHVAMTRPAVIRLVSYVRIPPPAQRRRVTRRAVFARDGWACQYCGSQATLTVDHVIPRSKGGPSTWENIVAACAPCNRRKGDRLPAQAGMHPRTSPRTPHPQVFMGITTGQVPRSWRPWLAPVAVSGG